MKKVRRFLPAVCITGIIIILLLLLYRGIYHYAENKCWQELSNTAGQLTETISAEFEDDAAKLRMMKVVLQKGDLDSEDCLDMLHLDEILPTLMFSRIDLWYEDGTVVSSGPECGDYSDLSFGEVVEKGEQMTGRRKDPCTGDDTVYYLLPITEQENATAVLVGVIDLSEIADRFRPVIYGGKGQICVVDSSDGNFIIDSWHDELGNAFDMEGRKRKKGYEDVDLSKEIKNQETGVIVFESKTTGQPLYMYYTPLGVYDWQFMIFAEEDVVFEYLLQLRRYVLLVGALIIVLGGLYFVWNMKTVRLLNQKIMELEEHKELLRALSYKDALTNIANRTRYTEVWKSLEEETVEKMGIAYFDLNGLKRINDARSHDEGDCYICNAAGVLSEVFGEECYRIGGDEFVVLARNVEEEVFADRICAVRRLMLDKGISISTGCCWMAQCNDLKAMRRKAEEHMYQEKEAYYQSRKNSIDILKKP